MTAVRGQRAARVAGAVIGAGAVALALLAGRPAQGGAAAGAEADFSAALTGELAVAPAAPRPFLRATGLHPGSEPVSGSVRLTNQTGETLAVRPRLRPSVPALDDLFVELRSGGSPVADGTLGSLRSGGGELRLEPGDSADLYVVVRLPASAAEGWQAALVPVAVVLEARSVASGGGDAKRGR